jgi:hypothetical protein
MFGDGVYFADKAQKSIGYTSLEVHIGPKLVMIAFRII